LKITFLIPAHNEENRIGLALDNMAKIKKMYPDIEVMVGNDGSTDGTDEVIRRYKFIKYVKFEERHGKHHVIDKMIKMAKGQIIIIHDADRVFVCKKGELEKITECFKDQKVGGMGDYYTTTYESDKVRKTNSMLYLGDAWSTLFMLEWKMKKHTQRINGKLYGGRTGMMFYVNLFRKELAENTKTMCDDGERYIQILKRGYKIRLLETEERPYLKANYSTMKFWGFVKTKVRGFFAQRQIDEAYGTFSINPDFSLFTYFLRNLHRVKRPRAYMGILIWWFAVFVAMVKYQFVKKQKISTKDGWKMRMKV
jgi:glycosyltransferase involved in cell wall biosynthesis